MDLSNIWATTFSNGMWILLITSLVLSVIGFYKLVYFFSVGYGFAILGDGLLIFVLFRNSLSPAIILLTLLFVCYGARLSGYLIYREWKSANYKKLLHKITRPEEKNTMAFKVLIWISVSVLYVTMVSPVYYRLANDKANEGSFVWVGIVITIVGLLLETVADLQKSKQKKETPTMVATKGLYRIVRCPNYFGEIVFWTGVFVSGWDVLTGIGQWLVAIIGYLCIVYIMFNGATRLEKRQIKTYGAIPSYQTYANSTPILFPWIPFYHLAKIEKNEIRN